MESTVDVDKRLLKTWVDSEVVTQMDQALRAGALGGVTTRSAFIEEALRLLLVELRMEPELGLENAASRASRGATRLVDADPRPTSVDLYESRTAFDVPEVPGPSSSPTTRESLAAVTSSRLLGMHNRDWPSLRALHVLDKAARGHGGLLDIGEAEDRWVQDAWEVAATLAELEAAGRLPDHGRGLRHTTLLPTNTEKRQSSTGNFLTFAVGRLGRRNRDGAYPASGPLYVWGAVDVVDGHDGPMVGVSSAGHDVLQAIAGLSARLPHDPWRAVAFLEWLQRVAPVDHGDLMMLLQVVADAPDRDQLLTAVAQHLGDDANQTPSATGGLVARSRAWGLVAPRLEQHRYRLTDFGRSLVA
jgi:hypothetical protein